MVPWMFLQGSLGQDKAKEGEDALGTGPGTPRAYISEGWVG